MHWWNDNVHVYGHESPLILLNAPSKRDKILTLDESVEEDGLGCSPNFHVVLQR